MVDIPKLMLIDEGNEPINTVINSNNGNIINSEFLYNNFHFLRNFAITGERPNGNQYKIYSAEGVPCLLYTSPSPRDRTRSRMPSSA